MADTEERRPRPESGALPNAGAHVTSIVESPTSVGGVLLAVEIDLLSCARRVEHAAVARPELDRSARVIFYAAHRVRGDRLAVAA